MGANIRDDEVTRVRLHNMKRGRILEHRKVVRCNADDSRAAHQY